MTTASRKTGGKYVFIHAAENLEFVGRRKHITIGKATVASRRSMLGRLSKDGGWKHVHPGVVEGMLDAKTFIFFPVSGRPDDLVATGSQFARESLWILASTFYRWTRRDPRAMFGLSGDLAAATAKSVFVGRTNTLTLSQWSHRGSALPVQLESRYFATYKNRNFRRYLGFAGDPKLSKKLKLALWRAAVLAGRSQLSPSLADAFLYQVLALDTLLLSRNDRKSPVLAERLNGLLGWAMTVDPKDVERVYSLRSAIVHGGDSSGLTTHDLHLADLYAFNALHNAIVHRRLWKNKQQLQDETSRCGRANRWPKSHRFSVCTKPYRPRDYELLLD